MQLHAGGAIPFLTLFVALKGSDNAEGALMIEETKEGLSAEQYLKQAHAALDLAVAEARKEGPYHAQADLLKVQSDRIRDLEAQLAECLSAMEETVKRLDRYGKSHEELSGVIACCARKEG